MAMFREDRFRMKLHAECRMLAMLHSHDLAFVRPGRRCERTVWPVKLHDQRVVTPDTDRIGQAFQNARCVMAHQACLAVHRARGAGDPPAKHLADTLMAKTNSENRHAPGIFPHEPHRHSPSSRRHGPGEITMASGFSGGRAASLRTTSGTAPSSLR